MKRFRIDGTIYLPEVKIHCDFTEIDNKILVECALEDHIVEYDEYKGRLVIEGKLQKFGLKILGFLNYEDRDRNHETIDSYGGFRYYSKRDPEEPNLEESLLSEFKTLVRKIYKVPTFYVKEDITSPISSVESALDIFKDVTVSRNSIDGSIYLPEVKIHCDFTEVDNKIRVRCHLEDHVVEYDEGSIIGMGYEFEDYRMHIFSYISDEDIDRDYERIDLYGGFLYDSKRDPNEPNLEESLLSEFKTMVKELYNIPTIYDKEKIKSSNSSKVSVLDVFRDVTVSSPKKRKTKDRKRYEKAVMEGRINERWKHPYIKYMEDMNESFALEVERWHIEEYRKYEEDMIESFRQAEKRGQIEEYREYEEEMIEYFRQAELRGQMEEENRREDIQEQEAKKRELFSELKKETSK